MLALLQPKRIYVNKTRFKIAIICSSAMAGSDLTAKSLIVSLYRPSPTLEPACVRCLLLLQNHLISLVMIRYFQCLNLLLVNFQLQDKPPCK